MSSSRRNSALPPLVDQNARQRAAVHFAAERLGHQTRRIVRRELGDVDADEQLVLPQRRHRFGCGFAAADRHDREHAVRRRHQVQERGRRVVEVVRIVDEQHEPLVTRGADDRGRRAAQGLRATVRRRGRRRQERRECPEGDGRRAAVGAHLRGHPSAGLGERDALGGQTRLADAGGPREQDAARAAVHGLAHDLQLALAPDERPGRSVPHPSPVSHGSCPRILRSGKHHAKRKARNQRSEN